MNYGDTPGAALAVRLDAMEFACQGRCLAVSRMHGSVIADGLPNTL
ncbi:hypothetical protein ACVWZV_000220 [Bradyrhizobium sp. GM5.1]